MSIFNFLKSTKKDKVNSNFIGSVEIKDIVASLSNVMDPETGIDIVSLGLIYWIKAENGNILVQMTMTTPACPMSGHLSDMAKEGIENLPGIKSVEVDIVWQPVWAVDMMSDAAKRQLGWS